MGTNNCEKEKIKDEKLKLHLKYVTGISVGIAFLSVAASTYWSDQFVGQLSFASTISSIILSVIAIIMTIVGESKSDNTKDKLIGLSENLQSIVSKIEVTTQDLENVVQSNSEFKSELSNIGTVLENKLNSISPISHSSEGTEQIETTEANHNCYIFMFNETAKQLESDLFKDICISLLYVYFKSNKGENSVSYYEYESDDRIIKLNIKNKQVSWAIIRMFITGLFYDSNLVNHVYDYSQNRYYSEVNNLLSWDKNNNNMNKDTDCE